MNRRQVAALAATGLGIFAASCTENLPQGPGTFAATVKIVVPHDTVVVGDSSSAQAQALDGSGNVIQGLTFKWTSADESAVALGAAATSNDDAVKGRTQTFIAKKPGRAVVTLSLTDSRFVTTNATRTETAVVGGVRILTTHDSTLSAVSDTVMAIASGLVKTSAGLTPKVSQGIKWTHIGQHASVIGAGDTIRYISRSNGTDTLIASHDLCLLGAKCADTAFVHVSQQLTMKLSTQMLASWSFADSLAPTITLADRRGKGTPGASIRFIPATAADSAIVKVGPVVGTSNTDDGTMATPRLISIGNGTAQVTVVAVGPDNQFIGSAQGLTMTVRQVARRIAAEPIRADISAEDSIPVRGVARDAHGALIADATVSLVGTGIPLHGIWAGPTVIGLTQTFATITPSLAGIARPDQNPAAPQIPTLVDQAVITIRPSETFTAGSTPLSVSGFVVDSTFNAAVNKLVRFSTVLSVVPAPVSVNPDGSFGQQWSPPHVAGHYTLTGAIDIIGGASPADSSGKIVLRRSVTVVADVPDATRSSVTMLATSLAVNGTTTITITVKDQFDNLVKTVTVGDLLVTSANGTLAGAACSNGVCTVGYTAAAVAGNDVVRVRIAATGLDVVGSPINVTVHP
jgi:hypothetical protein